MARHTGEEDEEMEMACVPPYRMWGAKQVGKMLVVTAGR